VKGKINVANLQIKGIDDGLYAQIKFLAASENRSVSQQVLFLIKEYLSKKKHLDGMKTPAGILLELSGSWKDERKPEDIVKEIKRARKNSKKLKEGDL
jgi:hypothetical protein